MNHTYVTKEYRMPNIGTSYDEVKSIWPKFPRPSPIVMQQILSLMKSVQSRFIISQFFAKLMMDEFVWKR